jgi:type VI secretion system protein ImpG
VRIKQTQPDYPLLADGPHPAAYEIHSIASACLLQEGGRGTQQLQPFYSLHHGQGRSSETQYWITRRDSAAAELSPGHELRMALVDSELQPLTPGMPTLSLEFICSNRDLPVELPLGQPDGDLSLAEPGATATPRLLRKPSASHRFEPGNGAHWRLISHLSLNHRSLSSLGLEELRQMLSLYDLPRSAITQRQIQGVCGLAYKVVMAWIDGSPCAALMPGIQISLTLDEEAFVGGGIHLFAQVLDHFFGLYGQINVFSQLLVLSKQTGEELMRCPPRSGERSLA